jgi:transcriptional regulator with XRE-family HTH domain
MGKFRPKLPDEAEAVQEVLKRAEQETEGLRAALTRLLRGELLPGKSVYSLNDLSRRMGRAPGYVSHVVAGRMELRVDHLMAMLAALDVKPAEFFAAAYNLSPGEPGAELLDAVSEALRRLGIKPAPES